MKIIMHFFYCLAFLCLACATHAQTWKELDAKTTALSQAGKIDSAIIYAIKEIPQAEKEFGKADSNYYWSLDNLGVLYRKKGDYVKAEPPLTQCLEIIKKVRGSENLDYASCINDLANLYDDKGDNTKAEQFYIEAMNTDKKVLGPEHPYYAISLSNLAGLYVKMGIYAKAEPLFISAININKKALKPENADYAISLNNLATLYESMGIYAKAEPLLEESTAILKKVLGSENPYYATSLANLAFVSELIGDYAKAETLYIETIAIRKKNLGSQSRDYASSLTNLAGLYERMGDFKKAETFYIDANSIYKKIGGVKHPEYAISLNNLALLYRSIGEYAKAEQLFMEAIDIDKKVFGLEHPNYARSLNNLAFLYVSMGEYSKAESLYIEAIAIFKKDFGAQNTEYATALNNLANLYRAQGYYTKAVPFYEEALAIRKMILGVEHPNYAASLNDLGLLYQAMGNYTKAEPLFLEGNKIIFQNINKTFGFLSESEKEKYITTVSYNFGNYQSFFRNYKRLKPSVTTASYNIELTTKGMILSSAIQLRQAILASGNNEAIALFDHWTALKSSLSKLYEQPIAKRYLSTDSIENLANNDEKQLSRLATSYQQGRLLTNANWKNIQQVLKPNEVAVEFASYKYYNDKHWTDTTFYSALVLRKDDAYPAMVNLCRQDQLDGLLNKAGNTTDTFISSLYRGATVISADESVAARQKLYKLIWKPIEKLLRPGDHIYYAPSGSLHQVAFAAIPREDGKLLSDRYHLTQLSSTAMLLQTVPVINTKNLSIAAYGGIKYDASSTELASVAVKNSLRFVSRSLISDSTRGRSFYYLPGTLTEITSIDSLAKLYNVPDTLYTGINATEESYKRYGSGPSPMIIHIATHGFFFPDPKKAKNDNAGLLSSEKQQFQLSDNPLNRAGLAFAGANHAWKGETVPSGLEDGILTAYEASNVPLSSTQIVVLSACETGLGDIKGSEGVFGLQRAFKAAGATYLMMSLWQVPDKETAEFMKCFYKDLFSGQSIEKAFASSQTTMKKKYRDDPYKWAAFVLVR